ncbi:unnamed protein product, partial [Lepidochelys olivacea]
MFLIVLEPSLLGKVRAKLFCRDYTRGTSRRRNAAIEQLEREVLEMERRLAADPEDPSLCGACREKREELRALEDHRARGAFVRSRIRLLREMDRGSRFFYALEKTRGAKKHVTCLLAEDGTPLTGPEEMCGRARDFYTSLFSPDPTDPDACEVLWEELPTVSVGDRDRLELPLTLAEFSEALRRMPTNKSPGMDGLTVEFYRAFWDILGPDLVTVWAESLQSGVLPLSCRRAVLALLPKRGDLRDLRNWRPVSLLSTDYKIVAKAISLRLGSVMADVVHPDQTYTVPGRSIFDNLFLVRDLLELGRRDGLSFALLSLDQEKAFDRVDHGYLLSTLRAFGLGPQFVSFLRVLYASAECLVRLNWTLTEPVSFGRGVRQGRLTGLVLREPELRLVLSAYADDVLLVVQDPGDLARVEACQAIFSAASSARVNWVKSSGLAVGGWRQGKVRAKLFCRDYTRGTSRRRNAAIEQLEREVLEMERRLAADPEDPSLCGACREKREELRALEDHRARGAFVRSRIRLLREMDRGSRFFYALEKTRGAKKHVTCLLAEDGTPLTGPEEMCGRARDFYTSLFSPDPTDPDACEVLWEELPTVSVGDRDRLELPLTLAEFSEALRRMPTNKSPGMDGLTVEFYRAFWDILGPDLVTVWAESLQSGVLPLSCRRAVLALLPKRGDLRDLRNWRPVSLLSTDYKIVAKAISLRLGSVMADVVHPDQTYTVPGRSIFDNLFLVRDLLELGRRDGLSFALLSLDQEKAFDRVDHGYLLSTLRAFGLGPQFVSFLRVLYASAECLVRRLTGLVLREPELRLVLSAYADDVLLVVQDPGDLARVEACQAIFSAASSARVNWVKSSGLAVGGWRQAAESRTVRQRLGKVRAKLFCRDYTRGTSRRRNAAIEQLEREVLEMERRLAADPEDPSLCGACREKREELRALEDHRARGAFVRSRIRLLREMDRGSRFFYALEKTRGAKKHVTCLLAEDGTPLTGPEEMCGRARDFYTSLFSPDPTDPDACEVLWEELPTVSVGDRDRLELPLTLAEFSEALRRMPTNKSPGMDGLTVEFYRAFWDILGPDLVTVWAESLQSGEKARLTGLVLREPELRLVLSAYADDVLLVVQDPGDLARVEACQAIFSAASSARVNWVKSSGLAVGGWRQGKVRAKLFCRDYTRGTSRRRNAAIEQLEREVLEMERRLAADPEDPSLCGACREKREELRALEDHRARGAFVRSRIRLLREMDRGSRFFYALEKTRGAKKHVTCLLAEDGTPLTGPEEMCGRARDFYTSLFSPDPTDPDACEVLWEELPTVSVGDRDRLELPLTLAEFSEALRRMPTNKSPGMDGLTVEFYRAFWDILGPDLVTVWAESLQSGVLPLSCRRAVLALLPKRGDLRDLRNWRPVSLLSTDYKIVAKAISLRLGSVMADVVHPDQTYTVPGRSIFDNLFLEKAFDRVDHGYLLSTLRAFGLGPQFVSFLRVLYASAECLVRRLTGLVLREPELRLVLSAYADDVLLVVQDPGDLARVEACQAIFSAASSARVNWVKSSGLAVGGWRQAAESRTVRQRL